jgi:hypothetical protein
MIKVYHNTEGIIIKFEGENVSFVAEHRNDDGSWQISVSGWDDIEHKLVIRIPDGEFPWISEAKSIDIIESERTDFLQCTK